ncbi:MAG: protein kinase [Longimicrobiales bacterium]|nr:protein kinase [Longimicrobiales bacterium]
MSGSIISKARLFFDELRRRRVLGAAATYVIVGWMVWEVADVAFPALGLPEWTLTLVIALTLVGFPLALVLGWAYDLKPEGVVRTPDRSEEAHPPDDESATEVGLRWARVQVHLRRLVDENPASRRAYLERLAEEEPGIVSEVESFLHAHDSAGPVDNVIEWLGRERGGASPEPGSKVAQYRLGRRLGGGGMGVVYEAVDERLERQVALKFLAPSISATEEAKARFLVEAKAAATLDHPNVCTILEVGEDDSGCLFLAMPYYDGETLRSRIQRGPLELEETLGIVRQIAEGLGAAHRRGIVHRDIKPANVILTESGVAKIVDFGVAKMADSALTRTGAALGSVSYMSPEQTRGEEVDHRSDLWSVGVVLFEMIGGRRPFLGHDEHAIRSAILSKAPPSLQSYRPDAATVLGPILERALSKEPEARYATAAELIADIDRVRSSELPRTTDLAMPVLEPGERRICTIVSARLARFEQLIDELGPEEFRSVSQRIGAAISEAVTAERGVVISSDGPRHNAVFGIPMTREDDGRRAVCAALSIRERVRGIGGQIEADLGVRLTCRTGVDSGHVVVRQDPGTMDYDVSGRPLRVAKELARRAPDDEILITSDCRRLVASSVETGPTAEIEITSEDERVCAHTLLSAASEETTLEARSEQGLTEFLGREEELSTLRRLARETAAVGGRVVQVVGEPGVGKSRLVLEFARGLDRSRFRVLIARALPVSRGTSYAPIADILRRIIRGEAEEGRELGGQAVVDTLLDLGEELRPSIPLILRMLSLGHPDYPFPKHLPGDEVRVAIVESVAGLFSLLSSELPLVLVFEDWHWADDASTSALRQLAEVAPSFPILLVTTIRPGYGVDLNQLPGISTVAVEPLGPETSAAVLGSVLGADAVDDDLARVITTRTAGNPFFIEEFGTDLLEQGVVTVGDGTARLVERAKVRLPDSVQAVIRTRLDRMDPLAKGVLFTASVIGREFGRSLLEEVGDRPQQLDGALDALKASGLVQQTRVLPEAVYRFKHALAQEVTYESLLAHQRRMIHRKVAEALEARATSGEDRFDLLAYHFAGARAWAEAMPHGIEAARRSVELSENHDALAMLDQVTDEWAPQLDPTEETDRLLMEALFMKERVLDRSGLREAQQAAIDRLEAVVERVGDVRDQMELELRQGDLFATIGRYDESERVLARTLERSRRADDLDMQCKALRSLGMTWWYQDDGREAEVLGLLEEALELERTHNVGEGEVGDRANICTILLSMGELGRALQAAEDLRDRVGPDDVHGTHLANYHLGRCHQALGNDERALEFYQRAASFTTYDVQSSFVRSSIAGIQVKLGEPEKALETYALMIEDARRYGHTDALARALGWSAAVLEELGREAEAVPLLEEARALFGSLQDRAAEADVAVSLASLYDGLGRAQEAVAAWGTVRHLARRQGDGSLELQALEGLAEATREHFGEDDLAVPLYEEASAMAESLGNREGAARILNSLGVIAWNRGDLEAAREFYERALDASRATDRADDRVLLLASLGAVHRKSGRLDDAIAVIEEAIEESGRKDTNPMLRGYAQGVLGDALLQKKDLEGAERAYSESLALRRRLGDERGEAWMLVKLCDVEERRGALDRVRELNSRAYEIASRIDDPELMRASTGRERY